MQAELPMYEDPEEALRAAVTILGGPKVVGQLLWPTKSVEAASQALRDALNPSRAEKLELREIVFLFRSARVKGAYAPFQWFASECGFDARPVTPAEEEDRATAALEAVTKALQLSLATVERLQRGRAG